MEKIEAKKKPLAGGDFSYFLFNFLAFTLSFTPSFTRED